MQKHQKNIYSSLDQIDSKFTDEMFYQLKYKQKNIKSDFKTEISSYLNENNFYRNSQKR